MSVVGGFVFHPAPLRLLPHVFSDAVALKSPSLFFVV